MIHDDLALVGMETPQRLSIGEMAHAAVARQQTASFRGVVVDELVTRMERHIQTRTSPHDVFSIPNGMVSRDIFREAVDVVRERHGVCASVRMRDFGDFLAMFYPLR